MAREGLNFDKLSSFEPKTKKPNRVERFAQNPEPESSWESREAPQESQFNIRAPKDLINRFKRVCKDDRRTYAGMLEILLDKFEENNHEK